MIENGQKINEDFIWGKCQTQKCKINLNSHTRVCVRLKKKVSVMNYIHIFNMLC